MTRSILPHFSPTAASGIDRLSEAPPKLSVASVGLDIGSTTVKIVVFDDKGKTVYSRYARHYSRARETALRLLTELASCVENARICFTGSGSLSVAKELDAEFLQESLACKLAIDTLVPDADAAVELGGEDAKITYFSGGLEQRMNETCAGGTGAFIDQMAAFLGVETSELDKLALQCQTIHPIASRCGVFAKSDALPLLNEGRRREDIAGSVMDAAARQTISGLAAGRPLTGKIVVLGGAPRFLQSLRLAFQRCLVKAREVIFPENGHFFVAIGAALRAQRLRPAPLSRINRKLRAMKSAPPASALPPLFKSADEYENFKKRHATSDLERSSLSSARGMAWLGLDCGSTTVKAVLLDENNRALFSAYEENRGEPLQGAIKILKTVYRQKRADLRLAGVCATGYGAAFLKAALKLDLDEVETLAHLRAAKYFQPNVSFVLDIGGQDIKCISVRSGQIHKISLNEACSSGCGSFIANFASSLNLEISEFVRLALFAPRPADLGVRCAVFMNSRVKQAQKDGESVANIAAGLSYSVIRNAIYKTLKLKGAYELGENVVVQGGAFYNDALLRALELELGREVIRPSITGLTGAFGAALLARTKLRESSVLTLEELENFRVSAKNVRCGGCENRCPLTVAKFGDNRERVTGNRCGKPLGVKTGALPNLFEYKLDLLFNRASDPDPAKPVRGAIGIPRALNIYENYPFWHALFTALNFKVVLSEPSSREERLSAFELAPSQTICYPAKLAHARALSLLDKNVDAIFFPCVQRELGHEKPGALNCPVVAGYPEIVARSLPSAKGKNPVIICDFLPLDMEKLPARLKKIPFFADIPTRELRSAVHAGFAEATKFKEQIRRAGEEALEKIAALGGMGVILAGRPYHLDPDVHHGVPQLINSRGLAVLTEDSVERLAERPELRVVNQWEYHGRLYAAAAFAAPRANLAVVQLISFGCGLDAVTSDQVEEIVERGGGLYAQIKIDEIANLGGADIRARSLLGTMLERKGASPPAPRKASPKFCAKKARKLLIPQMAPLHFQFAREIFACEGYDACLLPKVEKEAIELGLRHVNNDACYPAILVVGQLLHAVKTGRHDLNEVALVLSQTGGACRATNYVAFLRKALNDAGLENTMVANFSATMHAPGIPLTRKLIHRLIMAGHYGDALSRALHRIRPYEKTRGETEELVARWSELAKSNILDGSPLRFRENIHKLARDFDNVPIYAKERKPRVGLVGEILLKYHPQANNDAVRIIENEECELVSTDIMDFISYCFYGHIFNRERLAGKILPAAVARIAIAFLDFTRKALRDAFGASERFRAPAKFMTLPPLAKPVVSLGQQAGEGWLLAAEMIRMLRDGVSAILCAQPFGCLPNHIVGKGIIREIKKLYPDAVITPLDYDPGASETNQINRIKLMIDAIKRDKK